MTRAAGHGTAVSTSVAMRGATVNVRTQEAIEVLAVCLYHKEKLILESHTLFFKNLMFALFAENLMFALFDARCAHSLLLSYGFHSSSLV